MDRLKQLPAFKVVAQCRLQSRWYNRILIAVLIYSVLRLLLQLVLLTGTLMPGDMADQALPDDLRIYLDASQSLQNHLPLYPDLPLQRMEFYQYSPAYALAFTPFLVFARPLSALLHTLLHLIFYVLLYTSWARIFRRFNLNRASEMLGWTLPVWLVFSTFWGDLGFLNVYILTALLATLLIEAILSEQLVWSTVWLWVILQIKPQWAFAAFLPLLLGHYRFFVRLLVLSLFAYGVAAGATLLLVGPTYGLEQYIAYFRLLAGISAGYPWRVPGMPFLGYNHSIMQTAIYLFGPSPNVILLTTVIKTLILVPLGILALRLLVKPTRLTAQYNLDLAFALYLAAFIWLDVVWELALGIAVFAYLLATVSQHRTRILLWVVFLPYALVDVVQVFSYLVLGDGVIAPGPYVLTDVSIYLPIIMFTALVFYAVLVRRLWGEVLAPKKTNTTAALLTS